MRSRRRQVSACHFPDYDEPYRPFVFGRGKYIGVGSPKALTGTTEQIEFPRRADPSAQSVRRHGVRESHLTAGNARALPDDTDIDLRSPLRGGVASDRPRRADARDSRPIGVGGRHAGCG
jgi:hypothetical protein